MPFKPAFYDVHCRNRGRRLLSVATPQVEATTKIVLLRLRLHYNMCCG